MRSLLRATTCFWAAIAIGCSGSPTAPSGTKTEIGPHQATLYHLPEDQGCVEILNEPEVTDRRGKPNTAIVAYFYQSDAKTPLTPAPTDVRITLDQGRKRVDTLTLKVEPKTEDPAGGCRLVSKMGPYLLEGLRGKLNATMNGKSVEQDFVAGR